MSLAEIEALTRKHADDRSALASLLDAMNRELERVKAKYLPGIKTAVGTAAASHEALKHAVEAAPGLFVKPRTLILHGIKVGYAKGKGKIEWDDDEHVAKLIEKHFPEKADVLVKTTKKPLKNALKELTVAELKRIGCTVEETGDVLVIKPVDGAVEKMVNALLKDATEEPEGEEEAA